MSNASSKKQSQSTRVSTTDKISFVPKRKTKIFSYHEPSPIESDRIQWSFMQN